MASSRQTECTSTAAAEATLAKALAPEDIRLGDFVTPLFVITECHRIGGTADRGTCRTISPCAFADLQLRRYADAREIGLPAVRADEKPGRRAEHDRPAQMPIGALDQGYAKRAWKAYKKKSAKASQARRSTAVDRVIAAWV